ncbi:hypothetical protein JCM19294_161 [Nonlabens tegetincola]|uniref:Outer membrane protein beta-barrel domain-containing protein n=1 Tax=Nonlabens tegetincola TaxID=323273 RepID=A0A090Q3R1_9FLAO|nr:MULTISPECIES: porin family protein [Nonlabens]ALM22022.1 hypothetical protein AAT17_12670 [Nonlabens sp. MIC269]GAK97625.1 hypothetical protein JCM19294_161 [Nonlabens tegetincola]
MKNIILSLFVIFISLNAYSQVNGEAQYGFRLGLNYSNLSGDIEDADSRLGLHANFFAVVPLSDSFSLQPEIGLSAIGVNEEELRLENGDNVQFKTNWLQVGVLAKVNLGEKLYLLLGPQAGVNVTERDNNDYYNWDIAGVGGIGYNLDENWTLDLRYSYGFANIFDREFGEIAEANNRYFQLGIAYKL